MEGSGAARLRFSASAGSARGGEGSRVSKGPTVQKSKPKFTCSPRRERQPREDQEMEGYAGIPMYLVTAGGDFSSSLSLSCQIAVAALAGFSSSPRPSGKVERGTTVAQCKHVGPTKRECLHRRIDPGQ